MEQLDKKFSKQTWGIVPKIRELDELIETHPNLSIRESHPEVVFAALKDEPLTFSKRTQEGKEERLSIIQQLAPQWCDGLSLAISNTKRKDVAIDDIYDAFVLMLIAYYAPQLSTLPELSDVGGEATRIRTDEFERLSIGTKRANKACAQLGLICYFPTSATFHSYYF